MSVLTQGSHDHQKLQCQLKEDAHFCFHKQKKQRKIGSQSKKKEDYGLLVMLTQKNHDHQKQQCQHR